MGETTGIGWTDHTFNPWIGCTKVSQGCKLCYAETQNNRYQWNPAGWGKGAPRKHTSAANWKKPLEWARAAVKDGVTRRVFCASLADVFDDEVPQEWRDDLWALIFECAMTVHTDALEWLILTKRPENIKAMMPKLWREGAPQYIRIGVTAEDQENADKRIPQLLTAWKGKNFISYEPALGWVDFWPWLGNPSLAAKFSRNQPMLDWVIFGGESGPGCRPIQLGWAYSAMEQCAIYHVPFFMKQLGGHPNKRHDPAEWPEDLRVQEFPAAQEG